ncbi:enhancer of mRNA-decapping protein 4 isoform X1 [Salmo salar]|uniref:Enhancer of mRNA-decapping protein 4 n=1 Tax=Salmo salar TaxID=8030 RepID=A0A1S3MNZ3_SALSA|nr:enhancer of mRNA-decapping protein 4 isoform X1 [Salmo salar]|eukprot:XP_014004556.1 PREDICTED: enhancer of mRNA-decapping protein 4 isoform X1 [Salmo salar]
MASNSNIDIEGATQHLRDILKLDRPGNNVDASPCENQRKTSFNGELNGLMPGAGNRSTMDESTGPNSENMNTQECQIICLSGDDGSTCIPITSNNVEIVASRDSSIDSKARGSNKVKIQPVAKYDWEHKHYYGNLIAVSNSYLAYAIRGANNQAMIRVLSLGSAERTLLKGFTGAVTDLAFAHLDSTLLGCVDEAGNLVIWQLTCHSSKIQDQVVVHIRRPEDTPLNSNRRLIWCPFILEDNEENPEDASQTLALLHEDRAEVWDLEILRSNNSTWPVDATDLKDGVITIKGHTDRISEGALSPDGTVLATASHDGYVKFWQIYIEGQDQPSPLPGFFHRCLHEWQPHNGNPLSCLLFCDNHKKQDPDVPFWRFLITGADQNQELKMWCTVSWTCLQTIRFSPDPFNSSVLPSLKASLDLSAECLILSDVQRKVLYVMELLQDQEKGHASFTAVSEFLLTHPVLSFGVQDVSRSRLRHTEVLPQDEESESMTAEGNQGPMESRAGIQIKLYCVHTKSLQDVQIWFQPNLGSGSSLFLPHSDSNDGFGFSDHLTDMSMEGLSSDKESGCGSQNDLRKIPTLPAPADFMSPTGATTMPKLMTPDAFMTPSASVPASPGSSASSLKMVTAMTSNSDSGARGGEELTQNPKMSVESSSSLTLSASTSSPRASSLLISGLGDNMPGLPSPNPPLSLDPQVIEPMLIQHASPTLARSPDVISSASTAMSQDIPEIASETLQRSLGGVSGAESRDPLPALHTDSMASAASALHHLSPRNRNNSDHSHLTLELGAGAVEAEQRLSNTPSLLENALSQENAAAAAAASCSDNTSHPWPAAPDITRETRNSLRDNGLGDCSREEMKDRHMSSPYHRRTYHLTQNDSQDASAEQSDHDDEVASLASSSGNCGARSSQRLPVKEWKSSPRGSPKLKRKSKKDDGDASHASQSRQPEHHNHQHQMNPEVQEELLMLLRNQQRELADLRQSQLELLQRVTGHMDAVQSSVIAHVEHVMVSQQEHEQRRMERILAEGQNRNQQLQEHLSQQLAQTLNNTLCNRLDKTLREEMKKTVPPTIIKSLEPVTAQMNNTIAAKLTAVEAALKENVSKVVKSKNTTDAIGRAAAEAMQGPIQAAYKDAFQSIVLPVFERGCQSMFQQINDSFKQGTHEYIQQLETHMKSRKQREQEGQDPMIGQLQQMIDTFQNSTDQLATTVTASVRSEVQHQLNMTVGNLQESILTQVQRIVKGEVSMAMKEQQAAVTSSIMQAMRSAAGTPVPTPHLDYQAQQANILQLLQQGQLNQAFQQALSASDLNLVLYVCETIDSQQVFGQHPCPLIQPVLLSLIQQLSTNLATRSELKISYLEDAVMNLDHGDPVTRDHMSTVLSQVRQKLFQFLQQDPHSPLSKRARRLVMMLQGLVNH